MGVHVPVFPAFPPAWSFLVWGGWFYTSLCFLLPWPLTFTVHNLSPGGFPVPVPCHCFRLGVAVGVHVPVFPGTPALHLLGLLFCRVPVPVPVAVGSLSQYPRSTHHFGANFALALATLRSFCVACPPRSLLSLARVRHGQFQPD